MAELPAREAMEFDVVIVGAGPAGLAASVSPVSTGRGSDAAAHTGWSAGSEMPISPLTAQYGEPGPE